MGYQAALLPFIQIAYRLFVRSCRFTAFILTHISVRKFDVFRTFNNFNQIGEFQPLFTVCIELVKYRLHIVVFGIAELLLFGNFLLVCQSQLYPFRFSDWISLFLVILEPLNLCNLKFIYDC